MSANGARNNHEYHFDDSPPGSPPSSPSSCLPHSYCVDSSSEVPLATVHLQRRPLKLHPGRKPRWKNSLAPQQAILAAPLGNPSSSSSRPIELIARKASQGKVDDLTRLLQRNSNVNISEKNEEGYAALHYAAGNGHVDVVKLLLKRGAAVHSKSNAGSTPLCLAARYGHLDVVKVLLRYIVDIDGENASGNTALHEAADKGHTLVVKELLDAGASANQNR